MKKWIITLALSLLATGPALASSVAVLKANTTSFGREYFFGFSSISEARLAAFDWEDSNSKAILKRLKKMAPDLVFTIGALPVERLAAELPSTPFLVANYVPDLDKQPRNIFVMESTEPIHIALELFKDLFPNKKRIGAMFDPRWSQAYFDRLKHEAAQMGVQPAVVKVNSPQDVETFVKALEDEVDLIFWISDPTTRRPRSQKAIFAFARAQNLPVLSFEKNHAQNGALFSVHVDALKLGEKAWNVAQTILSTGAIEKPSPDFEPSAFEISFSLGTSKSLDMTPAANNKFFESVLRRGHGLKLLP